MSTNAGKAFIAAHLNTPEKRAAFEKLQREGEGRRVAAVNAIERQLRHMKRYLASLN